jgi:hypothetical protein
MLRSSSSGMNTHQIDYFKVSFDIPPSLNLLSDDGSGYFSDAKEFAYEITKTAKLMVRE